MHTSVILLGLRKGGGVLEEQQEQELESRKVEQEKEEERKKEINHQEVWCPLAPLITLIIPGSTIF